MHRTSHIALTFALLGFAAIACHKSEKVTLPGDDKVLAKVNGSPISQYDVDRTIRDTFSGSTAARMDETARKHLLESLVESRAISQAREKEMSALEKLEMERKVAAYREDVLVRQYLEKHTRIQGVSGDMVREYYEAHKDRFGGSKVRSYELLTSSGALSEAQRNALMQTLGKAEKESDWTAWTEKLKRSGQSIALRRGQGDDTVLHPKLAQLIGQLSAGQTSNLTFIEGVPYVARVVSEREVPAKPLAEVSEDIRKTLAPVKIKQAVKQASDQVLKNAEVAYR